MHPLILQSDFGLCDGAVSAMYGVAFNVCPNLNVTNLTHEIPQYNIWEASYRLVQTISYWPAGSVFVSVVDPGVGSTRRSIAVRTVSGHYVITPDNGTLTHVKRMQGIAEARVIDENMNRLPNSGESYTFHGRDIYAYTGARLASGLISFEDLGPKASPESVIELLVSPARLKRAESGTERDRITGTIDVLDVRFGSLWTNIGRTLFSELNIAYGETVDVEIDNETRRMYKNILVYAHSFADVHVGEPLLYVNSLDHLAVAINQGSFARAYSVGTGASWRITVRKGPKFYYE